MLPQVMCWNCFAELVSNLMLALMAFIAFVHFASLSGSVMRVLLLASAFVLQLSSAFFCCLANLLVPEFPFKTLGTLGSLAFFAGFMEISNSLSLALSLDHFSVTDLKISIGLAVFFFGQESGSALFKEEMSAAFCLRFLLFMRLGHPRMPFFAFWFPSNEALDMLSASLMTPQPVSAILVIPVTFGAVSMDLSDSRSNEGMSTSISFFNSRELPGSWGEGFMICESWRANDWAGAGVDPMIDWLSTCHAMSE